MSAESEHWTDTDAHEKLRLMTFARTGLQFRNQQLNGQVSALAAELANLREENSELVSCVSDLLLASCNLAPAFYKRCQDALSKAKGRAG